MKKFILSILVALFGFSSCSDFFDATPDNMLVADEHYTSKSNIYSAYAGLLTRIQNVAAKNIIISDLLSDVMTPTSKAPDEYWEIFNYEATTGNEIANPADFYNVVLNANDFLKNTVEYYYAYPGHLDDDVYKQFIAGAVAIRTWAYLQIGKIYGEAAYYDYTMPNDLVDLSTIPVLSFDELINELIYFLEVGVDNISGQNAVYIDDLFGGDDTDLGVQWRHLAIAPDALKLELNLWKGDYTTAATTGIKMITGMSLTTDTDYTATDRYTLSGTYFGNNSNSNSSWYWYRMWSGAAGANFTYETFSFVMFDDVRSQYNDLHYLCSTTPPCVYYLKPTDAVIGRFERSADYGQDTSSKRYNRSSTRGENATYMTELNETVMSKYHRGRGSDDRDASIFLYRATEVHLMIAEALVRLGNLSAADSILNVGFVTSWAGGSIYADPFSAPIYSYSKLQSSAGVRGRVGATAIRSSDDVFYYGVDTSDETAYTERQTYVLDSLIANETALEFTGEGKRWFTLMRMARNMGDPSFLIEQVIEKFDESEQNRYRILLSDQSKWFINYDLGIVETELDSDTDYDFESVL